MLQVKNLRELDKLIAEKIFDWSDFLTSDNKNNIDGSATAKTVEIAICLAALRTKGLTLVSLSKYLNTMITIYLQGELADYFTHQITVDVSSVAEAVAALRANFKNFANYLLEAANRGVNYQIKVGYDEVNEEQLRSPISKKVRSIRITPIIAGAGTVGRIIAGVSLLGLGLAGIAFLGFSSTTLAMTGGALLLSGISSLFGRQQSPDREDKKSLVFNGANTTTKEGGRVPIIYGVALVGMYVISAKITSTYLVN